MRGIVFLGTVSLAAAVTAADNAQNPCSGVDVHGACYQAVAVWKPGKDLRLDVSGREEIVPAEIQACRDRKTANAALACRASRVVKRQAGASILGCVGILELFGFECIGFKCGSVLNFKCTGFECLGVIKGIGIFKDFSSLKLFSFKCRGFLRFCIIESVGFFQRFGVQRPALKCACVFECLSIVENSGFVWFIILQCRVFSQLCGLIRGLGVFQSFRIKCFICLKQPSLLQHPGFFKCFLILKCLGVIQSSVLERRSKVERSSLVHCLIQLAGIACFSVLKRSGFVQCLVFKCLGKGKCHIVSSISLQVGVIRCASFFGCASLSKPSSSNGPVSSSVPARSNATLSHPASSRPASSNAPASSGVPVWSNATSSQQSPSKPASSNVPAGSSVPVWSNATSQLASSKPASSNIPAPSGAPVWSNATSSQPSPSKPTVLSELASGVPSKVAASSGKPGSEQAPSAKPSSAEPSSESQPSGHGPSFVKPSSSGGHSAQPASPGQPSSTGHTSSRPTSAGNPQPPTVGPFELLGCFSSSRGFPTFQKVASSNAMSLDLCASSCPSPFFGVYDTDCYCGQRIEPSDGKVSSTQCDMPCPGNKNQVCGGKARLARRGDVPAGVLLSVYERKNERPTAALKVVTSTQVITVTSCPPVVTDCPVGQTTTKTWIATVTPRPGPEEWHNKVVTCYGDYCVSGHGCDECQHTRVVFDGVRYQCEASPESSPHRLVHCKDDECRYSKCRGDRCNQKVVCWDGQCTPAACYGDECDKKLVCSNGHCEHQACHGEDCHKMWPGNGGSASHEPEPDKSGHNGAAGHNEHPAKPGNKADAGHDQGPGESGNKAGPGESGNKAGPGNKPSSAGPSPSGDKQRPAGVKSATHPENTSPVVAGSTKRAVGFHVLAAAVGLALMM
ncbi:hypothetical protein VCV18_003640 [Metarhizium anisopliae]